ncbi:amine oxidase [Thozetella sp. PMI_491]|nr:amine oxidase [Thozetella sp. PMI_491]
MSVARDTTIGTAAPCAAPASSYVPRDEESSSCRKTSVAVLGAGVAGIIAAQALHNNSIEDFVIIDRNDYIGGRLMHTTFGKDSNGNPYTIEFGANWIQGLGPVGSFANPIWRLAQKWGVASYPSNYGNVSTFDEHGYNDYSALITAWDKAWHNVPTDAGSVLLGNLQDTTIRVALSQGGWRPGLDMKKQAVDLWLWDFETAFPPETSSLVFGVADGNAGGGDDDAPDRLSIDKRGFNYWLVQEAGEFIKKNDKRLLLSQRITAVEYSDNKVVVRLNSGACIEAQHAICTFALGVLQNDAVKFTPALPDWKRSAIDQFQMGIYTKIFFQFNQTFWDPKTQFFLYADPLKRGYYPLWQSLSTPGFFPGSNIIFVTVLGDESRRIERQDPSVTKREALEVLRKMFPGKNIPEPLDFKFPKWGSTDWAFGSYSNWPAGMTLEAHQNLRANVGRLWFAGEAGSDEHYGFLQGAYFEGQDVGGRVAGLLSKKTSDSSASCPLGGACGEMKHYEKLGGTTPKSEYTIVNGWHDSTLAAWKQ